MNDKICTYCDQLFPYTEEFFSKSGRWLNGVPILRSICKPCRSTYERNRIKKNNVKKFTKKGDRHKICKQCNKEFIETRDFFYKRSNGTFEKNCIECRLLKQREKYYEFYRSFRFQMWL